MERAARGGRSWQILEFRQQLVTTLGVLSADRLSLRTMRPLTETAFERCARRTSSQVLVFDLWGRPGRGVLVLEGSKSTIAWTLSSAANSATLLRVTFWRPASTA